MRKSIVIALILSAVINVGLAAYCIYNKYENYILTFMIKWSRESDQYNFVELIKTRDADLIGKSQIFMQGKCFYWSCLHKRGIIKYDDNDKLIAEYLKNKVLMESSDDCIMKTEYINVVLASSTN